MKVIFKKEEEGKVKLLSFKGSVKECAEITIFLLSETQLRTLKESLSKGRIKYIEKKRKEKLKKK